MQQPESKAKSARSQYTGKRAQRCCVIRAWRCWTWAGTRCRVRPPPLRVLRPSYTACGTKHSAATSAKHTPRLYREQAAQTWAYGGAYWPYTPPFTRSASRSPRASPPSPRPAQARPQTMGVSASRRPPPLMAQRARGPASASCGEEAACDGHGPSPSPRKTLPAQGAERSRPGGDCGLARESVCAHPLPVKRHNSAAEEASVLVKSHAEEPAYVHERGGARGLGDT
eukprot:839892-Rhodomonas_salina.1